MPELSYGNNLNYPDYGMESQVRGSMGYNPQAAMQGNDGGGSPMGYSPMDNSSFDTTGSEPMINQFSAYPEYANSGPAPVAPVVGSTSGDISAAADQGSGPAGHQPLAHS